jgi:hypothetical protein
VLRMFGIRTLVILVYFMDHNIITDKSQRNNSIILLYVSLYLSHFKFLTLGFSLVYLQFDNGMMGSLHHNHSRSHDHSHQFNHSHKRSPA